MDLSPAVRELVERRLNSVEQIAVLILLRTEPDREWTVSEISRELRSTETAIARRLRDLTAAGVLAPPAAADRVRYVPASRDVAAAVGELLDAYRDGPTRVIELIYAKPPDAVLAFADAFRWKRGKS